ncbi:MAG: phage/plasmid replication protein, II/X family [Candidatus Arsenophonus phytopathogenicus]
MELITNLAASIPHLFNLLDVANTEVSELHPTLSVRLATESLFFSALCLYQQHYERDGANLIYDLWMKSFDDLLTALTGMEMNIYDDEHIFERLKSHYYSTTPKGNISYAKAQRIFGFYRPFSE